MEVRRDRTHKVLCLNQTQAILQFLENCDMRDVKPLPTPMDAQWKYGTDPKLTDPTQLTLYRSRVGSLSYFSQCTRPDIAYAVNRLARHLHDPNPACFRALNHLIHYLAGTPELGLVYQHTSDKLSLEAYADSNYGGEDSDCAKSQTGYLIYFGGGLIDWTSNIQSVVAQASSEAEQIAAFNTSRTVVYFRHLLEEFNIHMDGATTIWEDNSACIAQSKNPVHHKRTRHILLKYHYLRDLTESGIVKLQYICTKDQVADLLTKPLPKKDFLRLRPFIVRPRPL